MFHEKVFRHEIYCLEQSALFSFCFEKPVTFKQKLRNYQSISLILSIVVNNILICYIINDHKTMDNY